MNVRNSSNRPPLAERMRPQTLEAVIGQPDLAGPDGLLNQWRRSGTFPSMVFWGPPGSGKTTLARLLAQEADLPFYQRSAISAGVKEIREVIEIARKQGRAILFIDEVHRFNKGQQDALLGAVEDGTLVLLGATTENPSFEVNNALLSRCQVYTLKALDADALLELAQRAVAEDAQLREQQVQLKETDALLQLSGGDARRLLNLLEWTAAQKPVIDNEAVMQVARGRSSRYDKDGEQHYDIISAFIKSLRGSDPQAALYWMARMLEGGETPRFIARRMLILASEDIGNANPNALLLAGACFEAVEKLGMPEARIPLAQTAVYLAASEKSNAAYVAIDAAWADVRRHGDLEVPLHLRNAPTGLMKNLGYGADYQYAHDFEGHFVQQDYLPEPLKGKMWYQPASNSKERNMRERLRSLWKGRYHY